jgi:hypothetical protein
MLIASSAEWRADKGGAEGLHWVGSVRERHSQCTLPCDLYPGGEAPGVGIAPALATAGPAKSDVRPGA